MKSVIVLITIIVVLIFVIVRCDTSGSDVVRSFDVVVNVHPAWVNDGPGGTTPNGCGPDGKTWAVVTQKYDVLRSGATRKSTGPTTHCMPGSRASGYVTGQYYP